MRMCVDSVEVWSLRATPVVCDHWSARFRMWPLAWRATIATLSGHPSEWMPSYHDIPRSSCSSQEWVRYVYGSCCPLQVIFVGIWAANALVGQFYDDHVGVTHHFRYFFFLSSNTTVRTPNSKVFHYNVMIGRLMKIRFNRWSHHLAGEGDSVSSTRPQPHQGGCKNREMSGVRRVVFK